MEDVLLFGGAFNPVTKAHLDNAYFAMSKLHLNHVIFMPSKSKYILNDEKKDFSFTEKERLEMLNLLTSNNKWMIVSDLEIKSEEQPRTYITLKNLLKEGYKAKLLFGSDWLINLETKWKYVDEIGKEFSFVVMKRNNDNLEEIFKNNEFLKIRRSYFTFIDCKDEYQEISSSKIRKLINENKLEETKEYLPPQIYSYLKERKN